jgi:hypothetical protein
MALHQRAKRVCVAALGGADQFFVVHSDHIYTARAARVPDCVQPRASLLLYAHPVCTQRQRS